MHIPIQPGRLLRRKRANQHDAEHINPAAEHKKRPTQHNESLLKRYPLSQMPVHMSNHFTTTPQSQLQIDFGHRTSPKLGDFDTASRHEPRRLRYCVKTQTSVERRTETLLAHCDSAARVVTEPPWHDNMLRCLPNASHISRILNAPELGFLRQRKDSCSVFLCISATQVRFIG